MLPRRYFLRLQISEKKQTTYIINKRAKNKENATVVAAVIRIVYETTKTWSIRIYDNML
jgi:hypothetical protein